MSRLARALDPVALAAGIGVEPDSWQADEIGCREMERFWSGYYGEAVEVPRRRPPGSDYSWLPDRDLNEDETRKAE